MTRFKPVIRDYCLPWIATGFLAASFAVVAGFVPVAAAVAVTAIATAVIWSASVKLRVGDEGGEPTVHADLTALLEKHITAGRRISIVDPHTLLLKSWYFDLRINEEIARSRRYGSSMTVMAVSWPPASEGEQSGPKEIDLAQTLVSRLRTADLAAKWDEGLYAICLPHTDVQEARGAILRLLGEFKSSGVMVGIAECLPATRKTAILIEAAVAASRPLAAWGSRSALQKGRVAFSDLLSLVQAEAIGYVELGAGETFKSMKARLARAGHRAGFELQIWAEEGKVYFKRQASRTLQTAAA